MTDSIREVGKTLRKVRKNSEDALRRYKADQPKVERIRDIFDDEIPFEMEFETSANDSTMSLDLFFNKPPPARVEKCIDGQYGLHCEGFTGFVVSTEGNLFQVSSSYFPGSVSVFAGVNPLDQSQFSEYSPAEGLVYVVGQPEETVITICFLRIEWEYICDEDVDPLEGTPRNTALLTHNNNGGNPGWPTPSQIDVDTDPSTTYISPFGYVGTDIADYRAYIESKYGLIRWDTHLDDLDNLPPGTAFIGARGNVTFDPDNVDWGNVKATFVLDNVSGYHFEEELQFFTDPPEEANCTIRLGMLRIEIRCLYQDRNFGQSAGTGAGRPPRMLVTVKNSTTSSPQYELEYNQRLSCTLIIARDAGFISADLGGIYYRFDNPVFGSNVQDGLIFEWTAKSWLTQPSEFYCQVSGVGITPCKYQP